MFGNVHQGAAFGQQLPKLGSNADEVQYASVYAYERSKRRSSAISGDIHFDALALGLTGCGRESGIDRVGRQDFDFSAL